MYVCIQDIPTSHPGLFIIETSNALLRIYICNRYHSYMPISAHQCLHTPPPRTSDTVVSVSFLATGAASLGSWRPGWQAQASLTNSYVSRHIHIHVWSPPQLVMRTVSLYTLVVSPSYQLSSRNKCWVHNAPKRLFVRWKGAFVESPIHIE